MATLIFLAVAYFAPPEAWLGAMVIFGVAVFVAGFFYAPSMLWIAAAFLIPMRLSLEALKSAPGAAGPLSDIVPVLGSVAEVIVFVSLGVATLIGLIHGRFNSPSAYHRLLFWFQDRQARK